MKKQLILLLYILTGSLSLYAQEATTAIDVAGIKLIFKPTVKDIISVRMFFRGGVNNYKPEDAGIEHFALNGLIECGTKKYDANRFKAIEDEFGIEMGASSDYDYGDVNMICINKYFNEGWDLFTEAIKNPVYSADEVELLRTKLISAVKQQQSDPDKRIEQLSVANAFKGTSYEADPDGTESSLGGFKAEALRNYYKRLLNKNRMFIVVAGKVDRDALIEKIKAAFGDLPVSPYQAVNNTPPVWNDNRLMAENRSLATNYINAIMNGPAMSSPDYIPYRMGISAISGALFNEIRSKRNLSYDPGAYAATYLMPYSIMYVSTTQPKEVVGLMVEQLKKVKRMGISTAGLTELKSSYITSNYIKQQDSNALTKSLGTAEIMGDWQYFEQTPTIIDTVTTEQIGAAINKYIKGLRWSYLGDANQAKEAEEAFSEKVVN